MKKRTIFNLYWVSLPFLVIIGIIITFFFSSIGEGQTFLAEHNADLQRCYTDNPGNCDYYQGVVESDTSHIANYELDAVLAGLVGLGFYTLYFIGWVGALVNLSRAREWGWFWGVFLFSGIMLPIYAASGPEPLTPAQVASLKQQRLAGYPPPPPPYLPGYPPPPPPYPPGYAPPPPRVSSSALTILQERYARGEMDSKTYERMRAQLEK